MEQKKAELTGQIDSLNGQLVASIAEIDTLNQDINAKVEEIAATGVSLQKAEEKQQVEYHAMKKRIQYIYETGGEAGWAVIFLTDGNITELLNQAEYTQKMYEYDRECLMEYAQSVRTVSDLKQQQENEKTALEELRSDQEFNKGHLEGLIEEAKKNSSNFEAELSDTYGKAKEYQKLIEEQNRQIDVLVTAQSEKDEAQASETNVSNAAGNAASGRTEASNGSDSSDRGGQGSKENSKQEEKQTNAGNNGGSKNQGNAGNNGGLKNQGNSGSKGDSTKKDTEDQSSAKPSNTALGSKLVSFGMGFVGNKYVFGGNSLTDGIDCSGFVNKVYAHFGIAVPRSSGAFLGAGRTVSSLSEAQPGDVICYPGHVGIYAGGGMIVHASNSAPYPQGGIKVSRANYKKPISIRRFV